MKSFVAAVGAAARWPRAPSRARSETVILGSVGSSSANGWPSYVAIEKGFFAAEGHQARPVFAQSNAAVIQQLAAGSINVSTNSGLVDPIRAIEKGAPLAHHPHRGAGRRPIRCWPSPSIKSMKELKGKLVSVGGAKDITRIFVERCWSRTASSPASST